MARNPERGPWVGTGVTLGIGIGMVVWQAFGPAAAQDYTETEKFVFVNCGRCHVIGQINRMGGIGSTPSFAALRTLEDWEDRIRGFYALRPHPAFTQIAGVTPAFPENRPSPIHPIELTEAEVERIVEFAREIEPKNLGAEIGVR